MKGPIYLSKHKNTMLTQGFRVRLLLYSFPAVPLRKAAETWNLPILPSARGLVVAASCCWSEDSLA